MAFNIEPSTWKTFTPSQNVAFGYKIIQNDESSLIVSDPLIQINQDKRGRIYNCLVTQGTCSSQDIDGIWGFICGPTIPKKCVTVTTYNGMCFISENNVYRRIQRIPKSLRDCTDQIDIAFLLDGSGSVREYNFRTMKDFVRSVIKRFTERDAQFAIAQYSKDCIIHYSFNELKIQGAWESNVTGILYQSGPNTYTATAIKKLDTIFFFYNDHVFKVTDFNALNNILQKLEESIIAIEGYSMAVAKVPWDSYAILGAPRYKHQGRVIVSQLRTYKTIRDQELYSPRPQTGSYFGAEVCVVDLNNDSKTDLLLVSAPTYMEPDREGKVYVYTITNQFVISDVVLVGMAGQRGRFGSSLASPADLNGDGFRDVLIGAPLEEDGQGSIYIFNGGEDQINPTYSQRIAGSSVRPGLRFFGISLSQSSLDQTRDTLPDIAVGSMGAVLLLRSRPIMLLDINVSYKPSKIPTGVTDCTMPLKNSLMVCFTMSGYNNHLAANINYTVTLDAKRQKYRAYFSPKNRLFSDEMNIGLQRVCKSHAFFIEDFFFFTFKSTSFKIETFVPLDFEIDCGTDNLCVDNIRMDFNFSGATNIVVGIMQEINVTVFVENRGENSYNTFFSLNYPFGLSYRRITSKQGRAECVSLDGVQGVKLGETTCYISKPILKGNSQVVFAITYSINKESTLGGNTAFKAVVKSGNDKHSSDSELLKEKTIAVKYGISVPMIRHDNSTIYINFTSGKKDLMKPVQQIIKVENDLRELTFKIFIRVPVKVGDADIWANSSLQVSGCQWENMKKPVITNFMDIIKSQLTVNCSVAVCAEYSCNVTLMKNEKMLYNITGSVSSGWIEQTGLRAAVFQLVSSASLDYDKSKYVFFSSDSQQTAPSVQINTQVEVYEEVNLTKEIIGGVIGGLLLLALVTAALYKVYHIIHSILITGPSVSPANTIYIVKCFIPAYFLLLKGWVLQKPVQADAGGGTGGHRRTAKHVTIICTHSVMRY
uniref:Integrin, alpha M (complement component 3 receptor 3 subunit) n=1 Tax=Cyprinus carpio carpio TaxID=630221 RepID=A0A9J7Z2X9_CYPCA